jgi:tetratricopeptide (TPR) repeat protein
LWRPIRCAARPVREFQAAQGICFKKEGFLGSLLFSAQGPFFIWEVSMIPVPSEDLKIMMEAGYLYLGMQRYKEAQEVFEGVVALAPLSEVPLVALGNVFCVQGKFDQAIKTYQKALEVEPKSAFAKAYLGEAFLFKGHEKEALSTLEEASQLDAQGKSGDFARSLIDLIKKGFSPDPAQLKKLGKQG